MTIAPRKITLTITTNQFRNPFATSMSKRRMLNEFAGRLNALANGTGGGVAYRTTMRAGTAAATGTATCASVQAADTVSINGQALTATKHHATGTITPTVSGIDVDDTLVIKSTTLTAKKHHSTGTVTLTVSGIDVDDTYTLNGYAFTAKGSETLASGFFNVAGTDAQAATSLAACINASTDPLIAGLVTATAASNVVTVRKVATGTGTYTTASSDAQIAVSGATLTAGTVPAAGEFDISGSDAQCCTSIAAAIAADEDLPTYITVSASSTVVTIRAIATGTAANSYALTSSDAQIAVSGSGTMAGGAAVGNNEFDYSGTDAQTATDLARCINATTTDIVEESVEASASNAIVTITAREAGRTGNEVTLASSNGGRLAVFGGRLTGGAEVEFTF